MAYDLRSACPDVPSRKDASAIVLIMPLFALLSRLIVCLLHLALDHKLVWESIPGMNTHGIHLVKMQIPFPSPPVIIEATPTPIKLLVWGRQVQREIIPSLIIFFQSNPILLSNKTKFCWICYISKIFSFLALFPVPRNAINLGRQLYN